MNIKMGKNKLFISKYWSISMNKLNQNTKNEDDLSIKKIELNYY